MSEAEKKWENWDFENATNGSWDYAETASKAREAYKAALRREIEDQIEGLDFGSGHPASLWMERAYKKTLELLDTVEP